MPSEPAVLVEGVSKEYSLYRSPSQRLLEIVTRKPRARRFTALRDIRLTLLQGEFLGVLGKNGAGKTTLLQILAGLLMPTRGTLHVRGKVASLAELGGMFHPYFSGRENALLYARLLGLSRNEAARRMPDIVEFAGVGPFIDEPVRTYSTGMRLRLAFAATIHLDPDILLLDEVIAVGDSPFQMKCLQRMNDLKKRGKTFVLVSHTLDLINQFCSRAIVLDQGRIVFDGPPKEATHRYHAMCFVGPTANQARPQAGNGASLESEYRHGTGEARIEKIEILTEKGSPGSVVGTNERFTLRLCVLAHKDVERPIYGIRLRMKNGVNVYGRSTIHDRDRPVPPLLAGHPQFVDFEMTASLLADVYFFSAHIYELDDRGDRRMLDARMDAAQLTVTGGLGNRGIANLNGRILFSGPAEP